MRADGTSSRALLGYRMVQIGSKDRKAAQESARTIRLRQSYQGKQRKLNNNGRTR